MKTNLTKLLCTLVLFGAAAATASPMTYTETGYLSGMLGDTSFDNAAVTLTTAGDTANIQNIENIIYFLAGTTTIQIAGLPTATFTETDSEHFGAFALNGNYIMPGLGGEVGFINYSSGNLIFGNFDTDPTYDLSTAATFTGPASYDNTDDIGEYGTDQGDLSITGASETATFTASTASVPEPSQVVSMLALSVMGGAGALFKLRRRKSSASPI
jgi:hypothetical protein